MDYDVVVAGGGPAGLVAAETIASGGLSVLVLEKESEIGSLVHTSGGTLIPTMKDYNIPEGLYHPVKRLRFCSPTQNASFDFSKPIGCVIDVHGVYQHLAMTSRDKGVTIKTSAKVEEPLIEDNVIIGCMISDADKQTLEIKSKILIDATGYSAFLSKKSGVHNGFFRFGVGAEYELISPHLNQDEIVLVVGNRYAPSGYAWVFPWGMDRVRVGVGILHGDSIANPNTHLEKFIREADNFGVVLKDYTITEYHHGLIPSDGLAERFVGNGIMAVGDAAGQASLVVGEGIRIAMHAGRMAGETAVQAIKCGKWDEKALFPYEKRFRSRYGMNLRLGHTLNKTMSTWKDSDWDENIKILRTVPSELLLQLLMSEFLSFETLRWLITKPLIWPKLLRYGI